MPRHAELGPSSAARWGTCTASVPLVRSLKTLSAASARGELTGLNLKPKPAGAAATRGTKLHQATYEYLTEQWTNNWDEFLDAKEKELVFKAINLAQAAMDRRMRDYEWHYEIPVSIDYRGLKTFGTSDVVGVPRKGGRLIVLDWKYGEGVKVDAVGNPSLLLYGLGVYQTLLSREEQDAITNFGLIIIQPNWRGKENVERWDFDKETFWRGLRKLTDAAWEIESGRTEYRPSRKACQWCEAKDMCQAAWDHAQVATGDREEEARNSLNNVDFGPMPKLSATTPERLNLPKPAPRKKFRFAKQRESEY